MGFLHVHPGLVSSSMIGVPPPKINRLAARGGAWADRCFPSR